MHLINIKTLKLEDFFDAHVPPYAILSHRWGREELTYKEVAEDRINKTKQGYHKVISACKAASCYGVHYLWSDTCCINKDSSAELSEAINSMFQWYQKAEICLAYLADVESRLAYEATFRNSVWFKRAWTLQELLAPSNLDFYDRTWIRMGSKKSTCEIIETITGIPAALLRGETVLAKYLNATKLSWASRRVATRTEDMAYSLLGIFDVNMPPLYGEGMKAFMRLQEEMIRHTKDPTFLYWEPKDSKSSETAKGRLLAKSPLDFVKVLEINLAEWPIWMRFSLTNLDLDAEGTLVRWGPLTYALLLVNTSNSPLRDSCSALLLRKHYTSGEMYKIGVCSWDVPRKEAPLRRHRKITILRDLPRDVTSIRPATNFGFNIDMGDTITESILRITSGDPPKVINRADNFVYRERGIQYIFDDQKQPAIANICCTLDDGSQLFVDLTFDFDCNPCAMFSWTKSMECVWETSGSIIESFRQGLDSSKPMIHILGEETGNLSCFYRCTYRCSYLYTSRAKLPSRFIAGSIDVWVEFVAPWVSGNFTAYWSFRLWTIDTRVGLHISDDKIMVNPQG